MPLVFALKHFCIVFRDISTVQAGEILKYTPIGVQSTYFREANLNTTDCVVENCSTDSRSRLMDTLLKGMVLVPRRMDHIFVKTWTLVPLEQLFTGLDADGWRFVEQFFIKLKTCVGGFAM